MISFIHVYTVCMRPVMYQPLFHAAPERAMSTAVSPSDFLTRLRFANPSTLLSRFAMVLSHTERFFQLLYTEDFVVQTEEHVSPINWHLARTIQ